MNRIATTGFGAWLRRWRTANNLTQEELGRRLGYSADVIRKVELGDRRPSRQFAELLAIWIGVPPEQRAAFVALVRRPDHHASGRPDSAGIAAGFLERAG